MSEDIDSRELRQVRIVLRKDYSDHQRQWSTIMLTVAVAAIAVLQEKVRYQLEEYGLFEIALGIIVAQAFYAILRFIWYGRSAQFALSAKPSQREADIDKPLLYRLDVGVSEMIKERCHEFKIPGKIHGVVLWGLWTSGLALLVELSTLLLGRAQFRNILGPINIFHLTLLSIIVFSSVRVIFHYRETKESTKNGPLSRVDSNAIDLAAALTICFILLCTASRLRPRRPTYDD